MSATQTSTQEHLRKKLSPYSPIDYMELPPSALSYEGELLQESGYLCNHSLIFQYVGQVFPTDQKVIEVRRIKNYLLGIGWQFNKNVRILLAGEIQRYTVKTFEFQAKPV